MDYMNLLWLFGVVAGAWMVIKTEWLMENFGRSDWAEAHLGTEGGSRIFYKLIGVVLVVLSFMGVTGSLGPLVFSIFGRFFGAL